MVKTVFKRGGAKKVPSHFQVDFDEGAYVFREGDLGTEMYIIQDGRVEIIKTIEGRERQLALLEKGDFFGEMAILEGLPRNASARATQDTKLLQINGSTFDQMLRGDPEIAVRMMRKLSRRLRETDELLKQEQRGGTPRDTPEAGSEPPVSPPAAGKGPEKLIHLDTGIEFRLSSGSESTVGRQDPVTGIDPDVDLTDVDTDRSTSRRHAKVYRRGSKFFLTEEIGTTNGTFINGNRLETGVPFELNIGDEVQFGLVKMSFQSD